MAKNLKLNVKNAQLAQALSNLKKPAPKKAEAKPAAPKSVEPPPPRPEVKAEAPPPPPLAPPAPLVPESKAEAPPLAKPAATPQSPKSGVPRSYPAPASYPRPAPRREGYSGENRPSGPRPAYTPRPPYRPSGPPGGPSGSRPPYSGPRPAYTPRPPYRPGGPSGARPPYSPRPSQQGPFQQRPPYRKDYKPFPPRTPFRAPPPPPSREAPRTDEKKIRTVREEKEFRDFKSLRKGGEKTFDSRDKQGLREDDDVWRHRKRTKMRGYMQEEPVIRPKELKVRLPITIKELAQEMKLKASQLISSLFMKGVVATLNDFLDDETTIQLLGQDFDCTITIDTSEEQKLKITDKTIKQEISESPVEQLVLRPPVVTFMGHVDHGKTSLIDTIRKSDIAGGEAGEITQHIGAFQCHTPVGAITILDTPGHEAFSAMRERGAEVTDIVVLVIAGDEGIRAQTIEAMNQAKEAKVPIVVALNKSDKPNFNAENVYRQLSENELLPEAWGGTTITVNCSAVTGAGIKELLEMLALQAEILELKANPASRARGTVIESQMHKGLGSVATILVQNGTLYLGDAVVFDQFWGRIKTMHDEHGSEMESAGPSSPAKITGLSGLPEAGSEFIIVKNEKEARELSEARNLKERHLALQKKKAGLEGLLQKEAEKQEKKEITLILRADVQGSLEALKNSLEKIASNKIEVNIISAEVGEISESDIELAAASKSTIIGFHTQVESRADTLIKELKVAVRLHDIIYHAVDDVKELMVALLDKLAQENDIGEAAVKAVFKSSHLGNIAGCQVSDGIIKRSSHVRLVRNKEVIWKGPVASLKRVKEDVREVSQGQECGIVLQGYSDVREGDILQAYDITYLTQEL